MPITLKKIEEIPEDYPDITGLSDAATVLLPAVWARIEIYIAHRFTPRTVKWIVEGPGEWAPTLEPASITKIEIWAGGVWEDITDAAEPSALGGFWLSGLGPHRFTATVGEDVEAPAIVLEAVSRLAEYLAQDPGEGGASSSRVDVTDIESISLSRSPSWMAKAMQNSGAADLLRGFRNA